MITTRWRPVGYHTQGTWLIVGDVHGQWEAYKALLDYFGSLPYTDARTLVTLGDIIDKGPRSVKCLKATLTDKAKTRARADVHHRLWGNHEIMMVETLRALGTDSFKSRFETWKLSGADQMLNEVAPKGNDKERVKALIERLGVSTLANFGSWKGTLEAPGLRFAHAGFCPEAGFSRTAQLEPGDLWRPVNGTLMKHKRHWASIRLPFLTYRGKWPGLVFHGHSIPKCLFSRRIKRAQDLAYALDNRRTHGRICLDGGAGKGFGVAGAVIHNGHYQLLYAPIHRSG